jgi:membrane-associated phospholipid phosphatase
LLKTVRRHRVLCWPLLVLLTFPVAGSAGQEVDAPKNSPPAIADPASATSSPPQAEQPSFKNLPRDVFRDQVFLWLRPFRPRRADLPWAGAFVGTTAGLIAIDNNVAQGLVANPPGHGYHFSKSVGTLGTPLYGAAILGTVYLIGRAYKSDHASATGILGIRAVADAMIVVQTIKFATQRPRPTSGGGNFANHDADGQFFAGGNSFPSGHAGGSFALATVVAERNRNRPWIPVAAYGLAGLVSFSRITERRHFPSDVFVGAVLGYLIGQHVAHSAEDAPKSGWNHLRFAPGMSPGGGPAITIAWDF